MTADVLLNLLNEMGKKGKNARLAEDFFATSLISSIIQEYEC